MDWTVRLTSASPIFSDGTSNTIALAGTVNAGGAPLAVMDIGAAQDLFGAAGLLSRIAGVLTLNSIDILDVQAFTWRNGIVLDVFKVRPPPDPLFEEERWQRIRDHLGEVLAGRLTP